GGHFKAHVDTPTSTNMFASLVVCLPTQFMGGELVVRRGEQSHSIDWANQDPASSSLKWAAFYSDVEHEIHEITSGHRITLTYNIHRLEPAELLHKVHTVDIKSLPMFRMFENALSDPTFAPNGTKLGFGCFHSYATSPRSSDPPVLVGRDLALKQVVNLLGLQ
ncbi:hypothetical protein BC829DRAFT_351266, partial [Chytridium lagenaria]